MRMSGTGRRLGIAAAWIALCALSPPARGADPPVAGGAWVGITAQTLSAGWRERENYWARGVMVAEVAPGGPADRAGIRAGDVLVSIDSHPLQTPTDLSDVERGLAPAHAVQVVVARGGGRMIKVFDLEPGPLPAASGEVPAPPATGQDPVAAATALGTSAALGASAALGTAAAPGATAAPGTTAALETTAARGTSAPDSASAPGTQAPGMGDLGVRCENLGFDLAEALGAAEGQGVLVLAVSAGGRADQAGIRPGDIISWVGGKPVPDVERLDQAVAAANGAVAVVTRRGGTTRNVMVEFEEDGGMPPSDVASDPLVKALLEEVRGLREEVQKLKEQLASLARASNTHEP